MNEYPIFKNGIAYIDHTVLVDDNKANVWIQLYGVKKIVTLTHGTDHVNTTVLPCENRPGINTDSTAQWCIWKLLEWAYQQEPPIEIASKNVFVIGQKGNIGKKIYDILLEMGDWKTLDNADIIDFETISEYQQFLEERISKKDIIFLCISPENNAGFWNAEKMGWMKPNAVLISPSRPSVFSYEALNDKRVIWDKKHEAWKTKESVERKRKIVEEG